MFKNNHTTMYWLILPIKIYGERWCMSQLSWDSRVKFSFTRHLTKNYNIKPKHPIFVRPSCEKRL